MAEKTITQLTSGGALDGSELLELVQVGSSFKIDLITLRNWIATFVQTQLTLTAEWRFDQNTTAADPGAGKFRLDTITPQVSATNIYIDDNSKQNMDMGLIFSTLSLGDLVFVQQKADSTRALLFQITGAATDNTGWWTIPVTGGEASANDLLTNQDCSFIFHTSG
jgi:hypothetical protein